MIIDFPNFCVHEIHQRTFDLKKKNLEKKKLPLKTYSEYRSNSGNKSE